MEGLPSWRSGETKASILEYVDRVTSTDPEHVPPAARVAVFDNDGTLWCERPTYVQAYFILGRLQELAAESPELAERPVVRDLLADDLVSALGRGASEFAYALLHAHAGLTADEFAEEAAAWLDKTTHPRFGVPFTRLVYTPMLELLDLLRGNEFRVFVVTGGGVEFLRACSEDVYGIPPDDVIGSSVELDMERRDGRVVLVRRPTLLGSPNEGEPKPVNIQLHIGRRPIFAAGNSAGDCEMLEYATTGPSPGFALVVDHDDEHREYAYAGTSLTDPHAEPIARTAGRLGWTTASMRTDWTQVFGPEIDP
jgi:phosphoglycolate phosphatase-like HAD superfamily hydrolase